MESRRARRDTHTHTLNPSASALRPRPPTHAFPPTPPPSPRPPGPTSSIRPEPLACQRAGLGWLPGVHPRTGQARVQVPREATALLCKAGSAVGLGGLRVRGNIRAARGPPAALSRLGRNRRRPKGKSVAAPPFSAPLRPSPRPARSQPGLPGPPPALLPGPEAGVYRQGEWAERLGEVTQDALGALGTGAWWHLSSGTRAKRCPGSSCGMHEFRSLLMQEQKGKQERKPPPSPGPLCRSHRLAWVIGAAGKVQRRREEEEEAPGDHLGPAVGAQGPRDGHRALRTVAGRQAGSRQ